MKSVSQWVLSLTAGLLLASASPAANAIATGTVKSVSSDKQEFVLTDSDGKDWTFKIGKEVVVNRAGKESPADLRANDVINVCYDKGRLTWTANYILINEGSTKDWKLVHGTFKSYDADTKQFTQTETGGKVQAYKMGDATVRVNMKASDIQSVKIGDATLAVIRTTGDENPLQSLMINRVSSN